MVDALFGIAGDWNLIGFEECVRWVSLNFF
jgi:hypothetical protein